MVLMNEQNDFIRNIIANTSKSLYIKGAIINSALYLFALNGILFENIFQKIEKINNFF